MDSFQWENWACGAYQDFLERGFVLTRKLLNQGFLLVQLKSHFERLTVATMTCFTAMEYLCYKWPWICSTCRKHFPVLSSFTTKLKWILTILKEKDSNIFNDNI
jgi:hypothetical protein